MLFNIKSQEAKYMNNQFWRWVKNNLHLNGAIAEETWWGDEVTPTIFKNEMQDSGKARHNTTI